MTVRQSNPTVKIKIQKFWVDYIVQKNLKIKNYSILKRNEFDLYEISNNPNVLFIKFSKVPIISEKYKDKEISVDMFLKLQLEKLIITFETAML